MSDPSRLDGRHVLVTGGTRGIGRAISLRFARAGASVIANYARNDQTAETLRSQAQVEGLPLETCRADLTTRKGLECIKEATKDVGRGIPALVYCAATGVHRPFEALSTRHYQWTFALNVQAFMEVAQILIPNMVEGSTILAVSSEGAVRAVPDYTLVGASKGALESLARHLAAELATGGIRVNILSPGSVPTEAWDALPDKEGRLEEARRRSPLGRLVSAEEVAAAAQFLCSDASSGIVGHTLVIDGGHRIVQ